MFRLTREVRFGINAIGDDDQLDRAPSNGYGGYPALNGIGLFLVVRVGLRGELDPASGYLLNIKEIDDAVRAHLRRLHGMLLNGAANPAEIVGSLFGELQQRWPDRLDDVSLQLTPTLCISANRSEIPMMRLSQKFEFSAAHRLHNPAMSDEQNRSVYGKCNHPNGHGHNYEVQVMLRGSANANGLLVDVPAFERIVKEHAIDRLDHRHLNLDVPEFRDGLIPTVENIAMVIYRMLKNQFATIGAELASVTVWETPKTWAEYSESAER